MDDLAVKRGTTTEWGQRNVVLLIGHLPRWQVPADSVASHSSQSSPVNSEITVPTVQVEVRGGPKLGIMSIADALHEARRRNLDLLLNGPLAEPPFCEIMDMSGYVYNEELAAQSAGVRRPPIEPLAELPIPLETKRFLADVGLPRRFYGYRLNDHRKGLLRLDRPTLRARLSELDPKAMEDRDQGFWSPILEEVEADMS